MVKFVCYTYNYSDPIRSGGNKFEKRYSNLKKKRIIGNKLSLEEQGKY